MTYRQSPWNYWTFGESVAAAVSDACGLIRKPSASHVNTVYEQQKDLFLFIRAIIELAFVRVQSMSIYFHQDHYTRTFDLCDLCDALTHLDRQLSC